MKNNHLAITAIALAASGYQLLAHADWVTVPDTGAPIIACNPKVGTPPNQTQSSTLTTCKVGSLPGGADPLMAGYILKQKAMTGAVEGVPIVKNSVTVGTFYDRVYCLGTGTTCTTTGANANTYVVATRVRMSNTASAGNANCPVWSGATNECFEINNFFRTIRSGSPAVSTAISYYMGPAGSTSDSDPDQALALKYLESGGKTFKGLNQYTPPTGVAGDYDATHAMFQVDVNTFDPDAHAPNSLSSRWSPWLYVRQVCPAGFTATRPALKVRFWEGGEEGQINTPIDASGFACGS